jgi:hypothetical protein
MRPLTGGASSYYDLYIAHPTDPEREPYTVKCNDIIEALNMNFAEANVFKANWRRAAARIGNGKPGTTALYDAEKMVFFSTRVLIQTQLLETNKG